MAGNLLSQASLLEEDAKALLSDADLKRSQAYELAPDLRPKKVLVDHQNRLSKNFKTSN